ncbi:MAG: expansin-like protein [Fibrobacteria bacterium]
MNHICLVLALAAYTSNGTERDVRRSSEIPSVDTSGHCEVSCDASPPSTPVLSDSGGRGDVTTYGSLVDPAPSQGGACNYGTTGINRFAAIQVNLLPGDMQGQWQGGRMCGQCARVRARTPSGWKTTVVRIMDKCPDNHCGIDLGGAPARDLMGEKPGRYAGDWTWVTCEGQAGVSDGPPSLFVKEGGNAYWSLVQIRNAAERIAQVRLRPVGKAGMAGDSAWINLTWADEAENFFKVPPQVLQDSGAYDLEVLFEGRPGYKVVIKGSSLAAEKSSIPLVKASVGMMAGAVRRSPGRALARVWDFLGRRLIFGSRK